MVCHPVAAMAKALDQQLSRRSVMEQYSHNVDMAGNQRTCNEFDRIRGEVF